MSEMTVSKHKRVIRRDISADTQSKDTTTLRAKQEKSKVTKVTICKPDARSPADSSDEEGGLCGIKSAARQSHHRESETRLPVFSSNWPASGTGIPELKVRVVKNVDVSTAERIEGEPKIEYSVSVSTRGKKGVHTSKNLGVAHPKDIFEVPAPALASPYVLEPPSARRPSLLRRLMRPTPAPADPLPPSPPKEARPKHISITSKDLEELAEGYREHLEKGSPNKLRKTPSPKKVSPKKMYIRIERGGPDLYADRK